MTDWRDAAECLTADPALFFPQGSNHAVAEQTKLAKSKCGRCEVAEQCLEYALTNDERDGIWGGLDENERRRLARRKART